MPTFKYIGRLPNGKEAKGELEAVDYAAFRSALRADRVYLTRYAIVGAVAKRPLPQVPQQPQKPQKLMSDSADPSKAANRRIVALVSGALTVVGIARDWPWGLVVGLGALATLMAAIELQQAGLLGRTALDGVAESFSELVWFDVAGGDGGDWDSGPLD